MPSTALCASSAHVRYLRTFSRLTWPGPKCEAVFVKDETCRIHLLVHQGVTFHCSSCDRAFTRERAMVVHMNTFGRHGNDPESELDD